MCDTNKAGERLETFFEGGLEVLYKEDVPLGIFGEYHHLHLWLAARSAGAAVSGYPCHQSHEPMLFEEEKEGMGESNKQPNHIPL